MIRGSVDTPADQREHRYSLPPHAPMGLGCTETPVERPGVRPRRNLSGNTVHKTERRHDATLCGAALQHAIPTLETAKAAGAPHPNRLIKLSSDTTGGIANMLSRTTVTVHAPAREIPNVALAGAR